MGFCPHTAWIDAEVVTLNFANLHLSLNEKRLHDFYEISENALFFFFCLQWFMNLLICNRCVQPHTGKVWPVKSISILIFFNAPYFCIQSVISVWKVANIFLLNAFFEWSCPHHKLLCTLVEYKNSKGVTGFDEKKWNKTKNSICRGDLGEATNITLISALSCQLSALLTQLQRSPFDIYQMVGKLAKYLEDFQDIFQDIRRSSLI